MATKAKAETPPPDEDNEDEEGETKGGALKKGGLAGRVLGLLAYASPLGFLKLPLKLKIIVGGAAIVVLAGGGAAFTLLSGSPDTEAEEDQATSEKTESPKLPPQTAAFFDIPDIIVNIQSPDSAPAYLKLSVSLELENTESQAAVEPVLPRIVDQFQSYLRELRVEDIRGSAGVMRLKEELLRRVNLAVAPTPVRDVLLKEMIVQ